MEVKRFEPQSMGWKLRVLTLQIQILICGDLNFEYKFKICLQKNKTKNSVPSSISAISKLYVRLHRIEFSSQKYILKVEFVYMLSTLTGPSVQLRDHPFKRRPHCLGGRGQKFAKFADGY